MHTRDFERAVVALCMMDLKRRGYVGRLHLCGVNGTKVLRACCCLGPTVSWLTVRGAHRHSSQAFVRTLTSASVAPTQARRSTLP